MKTKVFSRGMHCSNCSTLLRGAVNQLAGVAKVSVNPASETLYVEAFQNEDNWRDVRAAARERVIRSLELARQLRLVTLPWEIA